MDVFKASAHLNKTYNGPKFFGGIEVWLNFPKARERVGHNDIVSINEGLSRPLQAVCVSLFEKSSIKLV